MKKTCIAAKRTGSCHCLRIFLLITISQLLAFSVVQAQIKITGNVRDTKQNFLSGATISLKGGQTIVTTDANGSYSITVPGTSSVLVFTNVGFATKEETVGNRTTINVSR